MAGETVLFADALNGTLSDSSVLSGALPNNLRVAAGISSEGDIRTRAGMGNAAAIRSLAGMGDSASIRTLADLDTAAKIRTYAGMGDAAAIRTLAGLGTMALQNAPAGVLVGTTDVQTLTNKTLTNPVISAPVGLVGTAYYYMVDSTGAVVKVASDVYNIKSFGATGDNVERALSTRFGTLGAAQAVYPRASALTESLDWHATQLAIDTARMAGGGMVYVPRGRYKMKGPHALIFPLSNEISAPLAFNTGTDIYDQTARVPVDFVGDGETISRLIWSTDKGSAANDNWAVQFADTQGVDGVDTTVPGEDGGTPHTRYGLNCVSSGVVRDLGFYGPNTSTTLDAKGCNMTGIQWTSRRRLEHVRIENFWAGIDVVGDHTPWYDIFVANCYYGMYFNYRSSSMYGDHSMGGKCMFNNCRKACWGFHAGGWINNWHVYGRCFMGGSPYGIFREDTASATFPSLYTGGTGSAKADWNSHCKFDLLFFEAIGNCCIADDNIRLGQTGMNYTGNVFQQVTLSSFSNTYKIATGSHPRGFMSVGKIYGMKLSFTLWSASGISQAFFNIPSGISGAFDLEGDIEGLNAACIAAGQQMFNCPESQTPAIKLTHFFDNAGASNWWEGRMYRCYATITRGDVMTSSGYGVQPGNVSQTGKAIIGIARGAATSGQAVPVAEVGSSIAANFTTAVATGDLVGLSSTSGKLAIITDITAAGARPVGHVWFTNGVTIPKGGMR